MQDGRYLYVSFFFELWAMWRTGVRRSWRGGAEWSGESADVAEFLFSCMMNLRSGGGHLGVVRYDSSSHIFLLPVLCAVGCVGRW